MAPTIKIYFVKANNQAQDMDNVLLPKDIQLDNFLKSCIPTIIDSKLVDSIQYSVFENFQQESRKLLEDNQKLTEKIEMLERHHADRIKALEDTINLLINGKMGISDISARPSQEDNTTSELMLSLKNYQPKEGIHETICSILGTQRHSKSYWKQCRELIENSLESERVVNFMSTYGLTENEAGAIMYYTSDVRNLGGDVSDCIFRLVNQWLTSSRINNTNILSFIYYCFQAYKKLPKYIGVVYRAIPTALYNEGSYTPGYEIIYRAFTSSTVREDIMIGFTDKSNEGTVLEIFGTYTGVSIQSLSLYSEESEILFFPGSCFRVIERNDSATTKFPEGVKVITLTECTHL